MRLIKPLTIITVGLSLLLAFTNFAASEALALDELSVGNSAPQITKVPHITQKLIDSELIVTITTTAQDPNGDGYFMNVCPETGTPLNFCSRESLCKSGIAESGVPISCEFSLPLSVDDFYITLCDDNEYVRCSGPYGSGYSASVGDTPDDSAQVLGATSSLFDTSKAYELSLLTVGMLGMLAGALCIYAFNAFNKIGIQRRPVAAGLSSMVVIGLTFIGLLANYTYLATTDTQPDVLGESITLDPIMYRESKAGLYEIFAGPSTSEDVIFYATENEEFPVLNQSDTWYEVLLPNGDSGWIPASNTHE